MKIILAVSINIYYRSTKPNDLDYYNETDRSFQYFMFVSSESHMTCIVSKFTICRCVGRFDLFAKQIAVMMFFMTL